MAGNKDKLPKKRKKDVTNGDLLQKFGSLHSLLETHTQNLRKELIERTAEVKKDMLRAFETAEKSINATVNAKFDRHNDYHTNQESKYRIWFKIGLGGILLTIFLSSLGVLPAFWEYILKLIKVTF